MSATYKAPGADPYDADGDGTLSEVEKICAKYDTNGDGNFSIKEVVRIVEDVQAAKKQARQLSRIVFALFFVMLAVCGLLLGLMFAANEASKESHVEGDGVMVDLSGNPTSTKPLQAFAGVADLYSVPPRLLNKINDVTFKAAPPAAPAQKTSFKIKVSGYAKSADELTLYTQGGQLVVSPTKTAAFKFYGKDYNVLLSEGRRRLTEHHGLRLYASEAELHAHTAEVHERVTGRQLQNVYDDSTAVLDGEHGGPVEPDADTDRASAADAPTATAVSLVLTSGYWPSEISWKLFPKPQDSSLLPGAEAGAQEHFFLEYDLSEDWNNYPQYADRTKQATAHMFCDVEYHLLIMDSYGDGLNSGSIEVVASTRGGDSLGTFTFGYLPWPQSAYQKYFDVKLPCPTSGSDPPQQTLGPATDGSWMSYPGSSAPSPSPPSPSPTFPYFPTFPPSPYGSYVPDNSYAPDNNYTYGV